MKVGDRTTIAGTEFEVAHVNRLRHCSSKHPAFAKIKRYRRGSKVPYFSKHCPNKNSQGRCVMVGAARCISLRRVEEPCGNGLEK